MIVKLCKYPSAVRAYRYQLNYWQVVVGKELDCMHKRDNPFDLSVIKVIKKTTGETVGLLPMENSGVTKYLIDRGRRVIIVLIS